MGTLVVQDHINPGETDLAPYVHFWLVQEGTTITGSWGEGSIGPDSAGSPQPLSGTVAGNKFTFTIRSGLGCQSSGTATLSARQLNVVMDGFVGDRLCTSSMVTGTLEKQSDDPTLRKPIR
jgi:hypothetical protein